MSVVQSENQPHDNGVPVVAEINIAKFSGKCGILRGEIVSPVEIVGNARYGTPFHDTHSAGTRTQAALIDLTTISRQ